MKRKRVFDHYAYQLMRITALQVSLMLWLTGVGFAYDSPAQNSLERRVSLRAEARSLKRVLNELGQEAGVQFVYSREVIRASRTVSVSAQNERLALVLDRLLKPLQIRYEPVGDRILLSPVEAAPALLQPTRPAQANAAAIGISGQVRDENSQPLPGVNVQIKSTSRGTTTDTEGNFSLDVPNAASVLIFSAIGYVRQEVVVGNRTALTVQMVPAAQSLEEVVVRIGYGEQERQLITTSVAKVSGRDIARQPVGIASEALAGLAAGVQVQSNRGGTPGEAPVIRVRGNGSLTAGNDPLYVVDGFPLQNAGQFNAINPSDIESIDVLKDAAAAAIYGSRAGNGVVIITTKRGKAGKTQFTLSAYTGTQAVSKKMDLMNRDQYIAYAKRAAQVRNVSYPASLDNLSSLPDTDWQSVIFRDAPISEYQLSASGGTEKVRFNASGSYFSQTGTLIGTRFDRYNVRFSLDADLTSTLKIGVTMAPSYVEQFRQPAGGQYSFTTDQGVGLPSPIHAALLMPPIVPARYTDGRYGQVNADISTSQYNFTDVTQGGLRPLSR
jgi:TonB-linked SusC/RagA family outer membrane protein